MNISLLRDKSFTLLIFGQLVSLIGTMMQEFALSLYVLKVTGSAKLFASVLAVSIIPRIIIGPVCGVFVDWFDRKKLIVYLDMASGLLIGILYLMSITVGVKLYHIYIVVILSALISSLFNPAISTIIPSIVKKEDLIDANSLNTLIKTTGSLIAPILAGIVYGFFGLSIVLLVNSLSFIFSSISEMFISIPKIDNSKKALTYQRFKKDFYEGIQFIKGQKVLSRILIGSLIINFFINPVLGVGFMYVSKNILNASDIQVGILQTIFFAGYIVGPIFAKRICNKLGYINTYYLLSVMTFIIIILIGLNSTVMYINLFSNKIIPYATFILFDFLIALTLITGNIAVMTIRQQQTPNELYGRVSSVWDTMTMGIAPLGQIVFGFLLDKVAASIAFILAGMVSTIVVTIVYVSIRVHEKTLNVKSANV